MTTPTSTQTFTESHASGLTELLCAILRGEPVTWPEATDPECQARLLDACEEHGVTPLVYQSLRRSPTWATWPVTLRVTLERLHRTQTAVDLLREQELVKVLRTLADHGVQPLLLKGTPLAYTHYASPDLRPRGDTDLLIQPKDTATTCQVLAELGYSRHHKISGELVMYQCTYSKEDPYGIRHVYDVHWKISNPQLFSDLLSFDELIRHAVPVPGLGDLTRTLAPMQALLLACMHRVAHHHNSDRLIWFYDMHVLVSRMTHDEQTAFVQLATAKQLRAICRSGLELAQQCFATPFSADCLEALRPPDRVVSGEATAKFLQPHRRRAHVLLADLCALSGWQNKIRLLKEYAFPPTTYLLNHYASTNRALLPVLYFHRALRGIWRLGQRVV